VLALDHELDLLLTVTFGRLIGTMATALIVIPIEDLPDIEVR